MLKFTTKFYSSCKAVSWSGVNSICRVTINLVTMKYALVILIVTFFKQSYQYDCKTPKGDDGNCIKAITCKPIVDYLVSIDLTQEIRNEYIKYQCDNRTNGFKVCCPDKLNTRPDFTKHKNFHLLPEGCGSLNASDRIVQGSAPEPFVYPWAALLFYLDFLNEVLVDRCGGSLINKRYVLTAAYCVIAPANVVYVRIGEHDLNTPEDCYEVDNKQVCEKVQNIPVEKVIVHPGYYNQGPNDIALLRLASDVDTSKINAHPICLPIQGHTTKLIGTVIGWGFADDGRSSNVLSHVEVPLKNTSGPSADACEGDGGGPLFEIDLYMSNRLAYIQYGVVSFGTANCGSGVPGIYTKISEYVDWILDNLVE